MATTRDQRPARRQQVTNNATVNLAAPSFLPAGPPKQKVPECPFCIVPSGGRCIIKPQESWSLGDSPSTDFTTFIFTFPYNFNRPFRYLDIHLRPEYTTLGEGRAAVIYGCAVKGARMGNQYYVGDLGPSKMSSFYEVSPTKGTTSITLYITIKAKSEVDEVIDVYRRGKMDTGPFNQLN